MAVERVLSNLNLISFKTEGGLQNHIDELQDGDLVFTPDNSLKGNLFDFKWTDHKLNDISWLNADTFSWQSGDVYVAAYEHLVDDIAASDDEYITTENGVVFNRDSSKDKDGLIAWTSTDSTTVYTSNQPIIGEAPSVWDDNRQIWGAYSSTISSGSNVAYQERISGITITFYRAEDGHKICLADQEANVQALYEATGVAWYYVLDTANKQFKLPRTKFGFTGLRDSVGNYVEAGLPNITGRFNAYSYDSGGGSGAVTSVSGKSNVLASGSQLSYNFNNFSIDASDSSPIYGNSNTVQPKATQMYLYFYVGNFEQSALEQTAGITSEQLNNKADVTTVNDIDSRVDTLEGYDYVIASQEPTSSNGYTWYRKYKSGWVEQGINTHVSGGDAVVITLPVPMSGINYNISLTQFNSDTTAPNLNRLSFYSQTSTGFTVISRYTTSNVARSFMWQVSGIAA